MQEVVLLFQSLKNHLSKEVLRECFDCHENDVIMCILQCTPKNILLSIFSEPLFKFKIVNSNELLFFLSSDIHRKNIFFFYFNEHTDIKGSEPKTKVIKRAQNKLRTPWIQWAQRKQGKYRRNTASINLENLESKMNTEHWIQRVRWL